MRILIVYASRYGATRSIAERIADVASKRGAETQLFEINSIPPNVVPYLSDVVVLAGSVYFGKHSKKLAKFAAAQRTNLMRVKSVFVSVSGSARSAAGRPTAEANANRFLSLTGWAADRIEYFAGGEPYTKYDFFTRWFVHRLAKKMGRTVDTSRDYVYTDWDAVDRVAEELATWGDVRRMSAIVG
ncbi:MAG: flavodoxin domain-containing protein [Thermoanaerobaculia bacterium]